MTALITGASRGIGRALFEFYRASGQDVIGTSRDGSSDCLPLDVTDDASQLALSKSLGNQPLSLLVCNAGVYLDKNETLADGYPQDMWAATFAANVTGVFQTIQSLLPNLSQVENSKIAIISSIMASSEKAAGNALIYRSSKAAVLNLGLNLATSLKPNGVAVGVYHPGWVKSDMGGQNADITVQSSAKGLAKQFDTLSIATTGCFETWDGHPLPI